MGSNTLGGMRAEETNKKRYGDDFYHKIGQMGGSMLGIKKGFAAMPKEKIRAAGAKGGSISDRTGIMKGMGKRKRK